MMSLRSLFFQSTSPRRKPCRGNSRTTVRPLAQRFLTVESLEGRTMLAGASVVNGFALAVGSDSGISPFAETFVDRITNVTNPTLTGTAPQGSTVSVYAENDNNVNGVLNPATDVLLGTATVPGSDPTQNGTWSVTSQISLNDPTVSATPNSERTLFAQDSSDAAGNYAQLNIFLDTVGPQVASVTFASTGQSVFQRAPTSPSSAITALDITFTDSPTRTADFASFSALNDTLAHVISNYQLTGARAGTIPISSVNYTNLTAVGGPGITQIQLNFATVLPDDTYTLTILDSLESDPGNAGDFLVTKTSTGPETIILPSGNGTPGSGSFSASFAVQGGMSLGVQLTQGIQSTDLRSAAGTTATTLPFYNASDMVFTGNFPDPSTGLADGYSKMAAYGMSGGQYRFLFQSDVDGSVRSVVSPVQLPGLPVAGNFDGNVSNGDEVGLFCGTTWYLLSNDLTSVIKTVNWPVKGLPVAGDFNGDGIADLATWSNGSFYVSFGANAYSEIDSLVPLTFPGVQVQARPVVADIDADGISDLGLWVPSGVPSTTTPANWYFLPSGGIPLEGRTTPFTPVHYQFGSSVGVPITGIFSAVTLGGQVTPIVLNATASPARGVTPGLTLAATATTKAAAPAAVTSLTVNGTAGNDTVQLVAGTVPGTWVLTVNGTKQTIPLGVKTLNLNGLGGSNRLVIVGTGKGETAEVWSDHTIFRSGSLTVMANNFTNSTINAGSGSTDTVRYHDVAGNGWFVAAPNASSLSGANYTALTANFAKTIVVSPVSKGNDIANFYPSSTATVINNSTSSSVVKIADSGVAAESAFFGKVQIYDKAGAVTERIVPTISWTTPAYLFSTTALGPTPSPLLSPVSSTNFNTFAASAAAAAAVVTQNKPKSSGTPAPATVDAVMASYRS